MERVEAEVLGAKRIRHFVNGQQVMEYGPLEVGGGSVSGHDPAVKKDGTPLAEGYIALQGESGPTEFRKVEILPEEVALKYATRNVIFIEGV